MKGSLVVPATSEFVQILNTGSHWVCLSTISTTPGTGTVKIFDSMYQKPNSIAVEHACRMLMYPGSKVTFINEKVQRQVGGSDCGLFSLAFATDLCHGLEELCDNTMLTAQKMVRWSHFPEQHEGYLSIWAAKNLLLLFTAYVDFYMIKMNMFSAATKARMVSFHMC